MKKSLLALVSFLLLSILFFMVEGDKSNKYDIHLKGDSFFEGLRIIQKKDGVPNWVLTAKRADLSKDGNLANLTDIEMEVKNKGITIYAGKALYDLTTRKISVDGDMTAKSSNYSLTTGQVEIDSDEGVLKTSKDVLIEGRKFTVQGKGMEARNNDQKVRILKDVKATFHN